MKIPIDKIIIGKFRVRERIDEEHVDRIAESFKTDGQWDPIIVRPSRERPGYYELISGEYRVRAAMKLGWKEIEATIKDVDDQEAMVLALKTNLIRKNMTDLEEAEAVKRLMDEYNLDGNSVAKLLGVSPTWVSNRLALVMRLIDDVREALVRGKITLEHAVLISRLTIKHEKKLPDGTTKIERIPDERKQRLFLKYIIERKLPTSKAREALKWLQNDTIYTIGYEGRTLDEFIQVLKEHGIELVIDIRKSGQSRFKPEFNEDILKRALNEAGIEYERRPDLGVPYEIREPYVRGWLSHECFEQWYRWSVRGRIVDGKPKDLIPELVKRLKQKRSCLMCEERYPTPKGKQKHYCHRHLLAKMIMEYEDPKEPLMKFERRVDL